MVRLPQFDVEREQRVDDVKDEEVDLGFDESSDSKTRSPWRIGVV